MPENVDIEYPLALILLLAIPFFFHIRYRSGLKKELSAVSLIDRTLEPNPVKRYGPDVLAGTFLLFTVLGITNIRYSTLWQSTDIESRWIMLVQDLSGSMNRPGEVDGHGNRASTLGDIALAGAKAFINMRTKDDMIGLIAFSSYAKLVCPPTFDKAILTEKLKLIGRDSDSILFRELTSGGATNASYAAWLALCTFFMLLPEDENPLSLEQLEDFRRRLSGRTLDRIGIPEQLKKVEFGQGMVIILFTDGRIDACQSDSDVKKGLPNFVNIIKLIQKLGVKFYLISLNRIIDPEVKDAIYDRTDGGTGRIFYMPGGFSAKKIKEVYNSINQLEKNRLLIKYSNKQKQTRKFFTGIAFAALIAYCAIRLIPPFAEI
ncbi:hypothetical protein QUF76_15780 [Desulfobacterales bacterium HSG16]|nr:hypothetical protein [Desulfobacterales bacterium HSG16]